MNEFNVDSGSVLYHNKIKSSLLDICTVFLHPQMSSLGTIKKTAGLGHFFILESYIHVLMYGEPTHILQEIIQQDVGNK